MSREFAAGIGLRHLNAQSPEGEAVLTVIETPKGSQNKYQYDEELGLFSLSGVLPAGAAFPYDFGFLPGTLGADGDPLDVLVLMEEAAFAGCLVQARLVGVIEAEQTERDGETMRNDRVIAVASASRLYAEVRDLSGLSTPLLDEIEHFFVSYNMIRGKGFRPLGRYGPERAHACLRDAQERAAEQSPDGEKPQ